MSNARNLARLLPNASGQLPSSNVQKLSAVNMASNSIVQVQQGTKTSQTESSAATGTLVDIGLGVSITPLSSSNKIKVTLASLSMRTRNSNSFAVLFLERSINGGAYTKLTAFAEYVGFCDYGQNSGAGQEVYPNIEVIDSPATTSPITYRITGQRVSGSSAISYHHNAGSSNGATNYATLTATEFAA